MFKFFENLVDPYVDYVETDHPPQTLWLFLKDYAQPFKKVFALTETKTSVPKSSPTWLESQGISKVLLWK